MVMVSRGLVLAIGIIGYVIALVQPPAVFTIVIFATSVLGSAFAPAYVCAVWWKKANTPGAIASLRVATTSSTRAARQAIRTRLQASRVQVGHF